MKIIKNLKTSDKITALFTIFNFIGLVILLLGINLSYFLFWYSNQKQMAMVKIDSKYEEFKNDKDLDSFINFVLQSDTIIIPEIDTNKTYCSTLLEERVHQAVLMMKERKYYIDNENIYFIFSKHYNQVGDVKILFNITPYLLTQLFIIKISLFLILISLFIFYFIGKKITKYSFKNLENISKRALDLDIEKDFKEIEIIGAKNDEINILASTINKSFSHIKNQTSNLKQFTNDVSHEFKTPLMVINSKIDLYDKKLEKQKLDKNDTIILLNDIKSSTKKLNKILETFLYLTRIENNIEKLEKQKVDIGKYIKNFTNDYILKNNFLIKDIILDYKIKNNVFLEIEKNTFDILFGNLLGNALKFSKQQKNIEIGLNSDSFWIKDNGIGIDKLSLEKIWDKFYRNDTNREGFGIGLFLVKRLVSLYAWEINVESEKGNGAKFIVKF